MEIQIAPSILSADFGHLADEIHAVERAHADWIHVDIMDGCFVPNITIGPLVVQAAKRATKLPLDVHLMIIEPDRYLKAFADAGADILTVHAEACIHLHRTLQIIRGFGKRSGVAFNPATPINDQLKYILPLIDLVLIMSVNPGFGGQSFIDDIVPKIDQIKKLADENGKQIIIEVDGGITPVNAWKATQAGATMLVAGNAVFGSSDYAKAIEGIRLSHP